MGIDLHWEDEKGYSSAHVDDSQNLFARLLARLPLGGTICLRFIDHYGNTTFNQLPIPFLISELENVLKSVTDSDTRAQGVEMLALARKSVGEIHTYLKFYGD